MSDWSGLRNFRLVRLNAALFPVSAYEASLYRQYQLSPIEVEANTPGDIIRWVADRDALFAISVALPAAVVEKLDRCRVISRLDTFEQINVFTPDEAPPVHPLLELDNVVLTPHVAAGSVQSEQAVSRGGIENVAAIFSGCWPPRENIVNAGVVPRFPLRDYYETLFETI